MSKLPGYAFTMLMAIGCGGDGDECRSQALTVPSTPTLVSLASEQRVEICDFTACQVGGYGVQLSCSGGVAVTVACSRQQCLAQLPSNPACQATVADLVGCTEAIRANPCVSTLFGSACDAVSAPECLTFTPNGLSVAVAFGS